MFSFGEYLLKKGIAYFIIFEELLACFPNSYTSFLILTTHTTYNGSNLHPQLIFFLYH